MNKKEIIERLMKNDSTVQSFPDRGPWGSNSYRGNCSGWYIANLIWKYNVKFLAEMFSGSGTGYDVCKDMGIKYVGADLNPTPVRPGIICTDAIKDDVPEEFLGADMTFMHPAYSSLIKIPYAGSMYPDKDGTLSKSDLGQMPWDQFITELNKVVAKLYMAMKNNSRMAIMMGDIRRNGHFYSMLADIVKPGEIEQIIIKTQHNYMSKNRVYSNRNFIPIVHEYIMVLKKYSPIFIGYNIPMKRKQDIRDSINATWRDVIYAVMEEVEEKEKKNKVHYSEIVKSCEGHKKAQNNNHLREKCRQVLNGNPNIFKNLGDGYYAVKIA